MSAMITSVLFDMDGVLVDSQPMHYDADIYTMKHFGVNLTVDELAAYAGTTNLDRYTRFKARYQMNAAVDEMVAFRESCIMRFVYEYDLKPIDGVRALLESIKAAGLKTAVASSSSYDLIGAVLERLDLRMYFDAIVSGEDMENGKPAPDIFLKTARVLKSDESSCVVIEDSGNGVLAANRAGMKVIGYINPSSGVQNLETATRIIQRFDQINGHDIKNV